jgi:hypothetical protein
VVQPTIATLIARVKLIYNVSFYSLHGLFFLSRLQKLRWGGGSRAIVCAYILLINSCFCKLNCINFPYQPLETKISEKRKFLSYGTEDKLRVCQKPESFMLTKYTIFRRVRKISKTDTLASSCLSVCLSDCPHGTTRLLLDGFS